MSLGYLLLFFVEGDFVFVLVLGFCLICLHGVLWGFLWLVLVFQSLAVAQQVMNMVRVSVVEH